MNQTWYMGIDPGLNGAMAFYTVEPMPIIIVHDFVTVKGGSSSNQYHKAEHRKEIAVSETSLIIKNHIEKNGEIKLVLLEVPHSLPNDGHVGAFRFGKACGVLDGILGTLNLKVIPAKPSVWKAKLGLNSNKKKSIDKALEVFKDIPNAHKYFTHLKHNDRAEAALLAWYAHQTFGEKQ